MNQRTLHEEYNQANILSRIERLNRETRPYLGRSAVWQYFHSITDSETLRTFDDFADSYATFLIDYMSLREEATDDISLETNKKIHEASLNLLCVELSGHTEMDRDELRADMAVLPVSYLMSEIKGVGADIQKQPESQRHMQLKIADVAILATRAIEPQHSPAIFEIDGEQLQLASCGCNRENDCPRHMLRRLLTDPARNFNDPNHQDGEYPVSRATAEACLKASVASGLQPIEEAVELAEKLYSNVE